LRSAEELHVRRRGLGWDSHRRQIVAAALRERGVEVSADPIAWQRMGD